MEAIVAIVLIFGTPIAGIASYTYLRAKKLALAEKQADALRGSGGDNALIETLRRENIELKNRVGNLEEIVNGQSYLTSALLSDKPKHGGAKSLDEKYF
jgi:hypothetical protein